MWNNSIKLDYLEELLYSDRFLLKNILEKEIPENIFESDIDILKQLRDLFPKVSREDKLNILYLIIKAYFRDNNEKIQLIWSGPSISGLPGRNTELVFEEYIERAKSNIIITIYSLSEYGFKLIKLLNKKARQGIYVEVYVNNYEKNRNLLKELLDLNTLSLFEYKGKRNKTQALHAKVLSIDNKKTIITSSNLSYNGMDGNLEIGVIIDSQEKSREVRAIFNAMIKKNYFKKI